VIGFICFSQGFFRFWMGFIGCSLREMFENDFLKYFMHLDVDFVDVDLFINRRYLLYFDEGVHVFLNRRTIRVCVYQILK
jgi:hypothetical protein